jgi:hypothetical protein
VARFGNSERTNLSATSNFASKKFEFRAAKKFKLARAKKPEIGAQEKKLEFRAQKKPHGNDCAISIGSKESCRVARFVLA